MSITSHPDSFIELENLSFYYNEKPVLQNISLSLKKGGFYIFVGPNGGGKTTLLKLILGILQPSSGKILIDQKPPKESRSLMGYVPQTLIFDPYFPLSVNEFVLMGSLSKLPWHGRWPKEILDKATDMLNFVEMLPLKDRPIGALSGGQKQRASLARALLDNPEILILDEPTTGLDPDASRLIQEKIRQLKGKKTIIFVTHTTPELFKDIDQMICIKNTIEIIPPEAICEHYTLGVFHTNIGENRKKND